MRILVVDDELISREKMAKILGHFGECEKVETGEEAISAYEAALKEEKPFELVSLDISLPEMSGIDVLKKIRVIESSSNIEKEKRVKIMMVTASNNKKDVLECIRLGCKDYIAKPFDKELIFVKLENMGIKDLH